MGSNNWEIRHAMTERLVSDMSVLFHFDYLEVKIEMKDMLMYVYIVRMCPYPEKRESVSMMLYVDLLVSLCLGSMKSCP